MHQQSVIVLLFLALLNVQANVLDIQPCNGGYCYPKHLCPTGKSGDKLMMFYNNPITLEVDEENECGDFMKICCKASEENSRPNEKCGISNPQGLVYSVQSNLTYAKYAEFPWTVAIFEKTSTGNNPELTHIGAGALIHPNFVLTTAHTLKDSQQYVARFGEWNMESTAEAYPVQDIEITEIIKYSLYRVSPTPENDIALVVLKENVIYSEHIRPICLPSAEDVFDGQRCISSGWGMDVRTGQPPKVMKRIELEIVPHEYCQGLYWMLNLGIKLDRGTMCVRGTKNQTTAVGDGGSPLACQRDDGSYVLAGIASWTVAAFQTLSYFPTGHMNATKVVGWINDKIDAYDALQAEKETVGFFPVPFRKERVIFGYPNRESK